MDNERYKIINQINCKLYNKETPVIIDNFTTLEDLYTDKEVFSITIRNIGKKIIQYIAFNTEFYDDLGNVKDNKQYVFENLELKTNGEKNFICDFDSLKVDKKDMPKIIICKIRFETSEKIEKNLILEDLIDIDSLENLGNLKEQYKREIREINNSINITTKYHDYEKYWHCVCGNYYFNDMNNCPSCKIKKEDLEKITNKNYLEEKLKEYEQKQAEIREKTIQTVKKAGNKTIKITIIIIIAIIIGIIAFLIGKDIIIKDKLNKSDISSAIRIDNDVLNNYKDYIQKLIEKYENNNNIDEELKLINNINEYNLKGEYANKLIDVQYKYILKEYENKEYSNAYKYLDNVLNSDKYENDSNFLKIANEIKYYKALELIDNEDYENAKLLLENLEYEDSKNKLDIANYYIGKKYLNNKQYKEAKEIFEKINTPYLDSDELLKESKYNYVIEQFEKYKTNNSYEISTLKNILNEFNNVSNYKESNNYISEIEDALKWHGTWHNIAFGENYYYYYDIKFNYFTGTLTSQGLNSKKIETKYKKENDKFVDDFSVDVGTSNIYTSKDVLYLKGDNLIHRFTIGGSTDELKYKR